MQLVGDTVGASVGSCYMAITNFVPESLFIMFLQYMGMRLVFVQAMYI